MESARFSNLVITHSDMVYRLALVYLKDAHDARDCCQNVFMKLYKSTKEFADSEHLKAWLITVTKNECRDFFKSFWRRNVDVTDEFLACIENEEDRGLLEIVFSLPDKYRDIIYLHYYENYKILEIALMLNLKESNVKVSMMRGRELLKTKLLQGGFDYD